MRSIFLERILKSFVGSINDILDDLKTSVEGIVDDISTIDGQLDSVKAKMDEVIVAFGQGTQRVSFTLVNANNHVKINDSNIVFDTNSAVTSFDNMLSMGAGYIGFHMVYDESKNAANEDPPATKKTEFQYRITPDGGSAGSWTSLFYTTGVKQSGTPEQDKESSEIQVAINYKDLIELRAVNGSAVSGNTEKAVLKGLFIDYALVSVTEPGGAFIRS